MSKLADLTLELQQTQISNHSNKIIPDAQITQEPGDVSPPLPSLDTKEPLKQTKQSRPSSARPSPTLSMSSYAGTSQHPNPRARLLLNMPDTPTSLAGKEEDPFAAKFAPNSSEMKGVYSAQQSRSSSMAAESGSEWEDEESVKPKKKKKQQKVKSRSHDDAQQSQSRNEHSEPSRPNTATQVSRRSSFNDNKADKFDKSSKQRWAALKSKIIGNKGPIQSRTGAEVDLVSECMYGMLPAVMLKMALDRDEHQSPRIPVFLHHLKIRVSDSVHPLSNTHAMFRIECQYGDSNLRWTIYRELRDFVSLHTHFRVASVRRTMEGLPEFPKTSLPYFNLLKREVRLKGRELSKSDFARMQRDALQNYLIDLIRSTMFSSSANRICRFFEFSAMTVFLISKGGSQGKAGYLRIMSNNCGRLSAQPSIVSGIKLKKLREPKWWIVRDDYLVCVEDAHSINLYDVFLIDSDFSIERPKRYYRQTANAIRAPFVEGEAFIQQHHPHLPGHHPRQATQPKDSKLDHVKSIDTRPSSSYARENSADEANLNLEQQQINDNVDSDNQLVSSTYKKDKNKTKDTSTHTFYIRNSERRMKLVAKNERQMEQFIQSMMMMKNMTPWSQIHRFDSYAPVRLNVSAQWLVDGRDYYWQLSRAVSLAQESIYIHDWWLSPELQLRRPGQHKWKLSNLLQRKAEEGVKIYVIVYREVSNEFTPIDSNYTKQTLRSLHENIMVQRSPSHLSTGVLYFSHHEKLCVIDQTMAFMGGLDLCFGRWDTPQHICVDEGGENGNDFIWPGKDYSNARVSDFHSLTKPYEDIFDRPTTPRMPWHDVALQLIGQPARDLSRHFIQRWNYLLRTKHHSRELPFLLPPGDLTNAELENQRMKGTLEMQICRSCGPWSIGTPDKVEHSIQNAYVKAIQKSEHFVYIENQFFVTSTIVDTTVIENQIGDALVNRIIRAYRENQTWRACIIVPLLPGYAESVDNPNASSVRLIVDCQNRSICRGAHSIFARLRKEGIDPDDYITFFSLRSWGKFKSGNLTSEILYIHAKTMTVDDRLTIIGSANINERSQRGDRDSEIASIIRDTDMIDSQMAGKPYKVGRFNHSLRVRLMREHLGIDVDDIKSNETFAKGESEAVSHEQPQANGEEGIGQTSGSKYWAPENDHIHTKDDRHYHNKQAPDLEVTEPLDRLQNAIKRSYQELRGEANDDASISKKVEQDEADKVNGDNLITPERPYGSNVERRTRSRGYSATSSATAFDQRRGRRSTIATTKSGNFTMPFPGPSFDKDSFIDPCSETFFEDIWIASAIYNTEIYRKVFHVTPDDTVTTWGHLKNFNMLADKHKRPIVEDLTNGVERSNSGSSSRYLNGFTNNDEESNGSPKPQRSRRNTRNPSVTAEPGGYTRSEIESMEKMLNQLKGNLVLYPTKFLETEDMSGNFLFNADHLHPLQVYN
ncbi:phospholipase D [Wallemia mellicola]|nr:phospholipase D [Wallemia mellicola]